jgi:regulator of replication initiation timing
MHIDYESKSSKQLHKLRKKYKRLKGQARMLLSENDRLRAMVEHDKLRAAADKERMKATKDEIHRLRQIENHARSQSPVV